MYYNLSQLPVCLETFCNKKSFHYQLGLPFRRGEFVYATDGRICVRMPADSYDGPVATEGKFPKIESLDWDKEVVKWGPVPEPQPCDKCHDLRVRPYVEPKEDNHSLMVPCGKCTVEIEGRKLAWWLVEAVTRFATGLEVGVTTDLEAAVHFRFNGGYALLMTREN